MSGFTYAGCELRRLSAHASFLVARGAFPALVASDFPVERERGTIELLLACPHRPRSIFLGKFCCHAIHALGLLATALPLAFVAVVVGGFPAWRAAAACAGIALSSILGVAVALRVSLSGWGSVTSALAAVLAQAAMVGLTALLGVFIGQFKG